MAARSVSVKLLLDAVAYALRDHEDLFDRIADSVKEDAKQAFSDILDQMFSDGDAANAGRITIVVAMALFFRYRFDVRLEELFDEIAAVDKNL